MEGGERKQERGCGIKERESVVFSEIFFMRMMNI